MPAMQSAACATGHGWDGMKCNRSIQTIQRNGQGWRGHARHVILATRNLPGGVGGQGPDAGLLAPQGRRGKRHSSNSCTLDLWFACHNPHHILRGPFAWRKAHARPCASTGCSLSRAAPRWAAHRRGLGGCTLPKGSGPCGHPPSSWAVMPSCSFPSYTLILCNFTSSSHCLATDTASHRFGAPLLDWHVPHVPGHFPLLARSRWRLESQPECNLL